MAAVKVVLPWSTCPIVPMFTCGLLRSNFSLLIVLFESPQSEKHRSIRSYATPWLLFTGNTLNFRDYFLSHVLGGLIVTLEMHCRSCATLGCGTQISRVAKHLRQRHISGNHLGTARPHLGSGELAPTLHQIAINGAYIIVRRYHLDSHDRLQQHRLGLPDCVLKSQRTGDNKGALVRVNLVKPAIHQTHFNVNQIIAGEEATFHGIVNALFGWLNEFARNCSTLDLALEHKPFTRRRFNLELDMRVLSTATSLLLEYFFSGSSLRNGFAIGDLRLADICFDAEFAFHAIDDDLEVQLAHAGNNCLAGFVIGRNIER